MLLTEFWFAPRMVLRHRPAVAVRLFLLCVGVAASRRDAAAQAPAQQVTAAPAARPASARRADLQTALANFDARARSEHDGAKREAYATQANLIRARLRYGDFQAGHRILLFVAGDSALSDTFTVRSDQKLQLPNLPEISLAGVLDSELQSYLQTQLAQYIRNPSIRVQTLLRVQLSGNVANPGFYAIPTDMPVSDVIMKAGGPGPSANMSRAELRRGGSVVVKREGIQEAFRSDLSMSDIGARPGDELFVPTKSEGSNWTKIAGVAASATGIIWTVVYLTRR